MGIWVTLKIVAFELDERVLAGVRVLGNLPNLGLGRLCIDFGGWGVRDTLCLSGGSGLDGCGNSGNRRIDVTRTLLWR